ncbi:phosphodiester glycosidase family protein [Thermoanaerobacterium sp. RBIITD]|uniref:phosphodiester glycosidase family protein n=1 Tax=Thermoanaerobacterium sp. RBIITD TaxID=1550240 RepID=UPI000BB8AB70|nr:phosphodiester glycosidase family protein [Thermoanaerobacterium sp. RBIITD]SNX52708.1 Exopolysaccharide biosynthesis protein [Thermoanaerobacterium sp. RBIITD]
MLKRISFKEIIIFIVFELTFTTITMPLTVFYGPFTNVRNTIVTTAMTTLKHQYIATMFLPKSLTDKIMNDNKQISTGNSDANKINIKNRDNTIEIYNVYGKHFEGKIMLIHDPLRVEVGLSSKMPEQGETTSQIAKANKAIAAINAGGFGDSGMKGIGGSPLGFVIHNGKIVYSEKTNENDKVDLIGFTTSGKMLVGKYKYGDIKDLNIREAVSFGPALIINGEPMVKGDGGWGIAPRTAIGQRQDGTVIFLTIDGRTVKSIGATLKDIQEIMLNYDAYNAANLDGGSSTTMYYNGKVINNPSDTLGERSVPTTFIVK